MTRDDPSYSTRDDPKRPETTQSDLWVRIWNVGVQDVPSVRILWSISAPFVSVRILSYLLLDSKKLSRGDVSAAALRCVLRDLAQKLSRGRFFSATSLHNVHVPDRGYTTPTFLRFPESPELLALPQSPESPEFLPLPRLPPESPESPHLPPLPQLPESPRLRHSGCLAFSATPSVSLDAPRAADAARGKGLVIHQ